MAQINIFKNEKEFVNYSADEVIFKEGEPGDVMYVVLEGEVDVLIGDKVLDTVSEGGVVGEMALIDTAHRSATAKARSDCKLVPLDETRFKIYVHNTPFFAVQVMRIMADRLRRMNEMV